jgi:hypothetical protein
VVASVMMGAPLASCDVGGVTKDAVTDTETDTDTDTRSGDIDVAMSFCHPWDPVESLGFVREYAGGV